jgi:hypothetical protein
MLAASVVTRGNFSGDRVLEPAALVVIARTPVVLLYVACAHDRHRSRQR